MIRVLEAPRKPGVRNYNLVGPDITSNIPAAEVLVSILGDSYNLDYYHFPGNEYKPLYAMDRLQTDYGYVPIRSTRRYQH